jgi:peroxiredoxin
MHVRGFRRPSNMRWLGALFGGVAPSSAWFVGVAACALATASCGAEGAGGSGATSAADGKGGATGAGSMATDFAVRDTDGRTFRLSDHLGKEVILLDFWATWCEPCLSEMPHLEQIYEDNRAKGFVVVALSMDGPETVADVPMFAKRHNMTFPVVLDEDSHVVSVYNPKRSAPLSVLIDRKGRIVRVRESYNSGDEKLVAADVAQALAGPQP